MARTDGYEAVPSSDEPASAIRPAHGVAEIEAVATVWSAKTLYIGYALALLIFFVNSFQQETTGSLAPYVYSRFTEHSLVATTNVLTNIIGGVSRLPIARLIDVWGRPEGLVLTVVLCTLGLILMTASHNVETYVAAQVLYWVGYNGMNYVLHVFLADTTDLVNRAFVYGVASTPYIVTTFAGPAAAQWLYRHGALWWGFGLFAVLTPLVAMPLVLVLWSTRQKARDAGLLRPLLASPVARSWTQSVKHYWAEFDGLGLMLLTTAFVLILLPLTLATSGRHTWGTTLADRWTRPDILGMLVLGGIAGVAFVLWERRLGASARLLPFSRLQDRTLLGACLLAAVLFATFYTYDLYLSSYLQVVFDINIRNTGYISNIYSIGTCAWSVPLGLLIRRSGRLKWITMAAIPLMVLGVGLMLQFRSPSSRLQYVILCEVLKAIAGGTFVICDEMAAMATGTHETIAVSYALAELFSKMGAGVGSAISGAIWTSTVPEALERALPPDRRHKAAALYGSLAEILAYRMGTPERDAAIHAYGLAQRRMVMAGLGILPVAVVAVLMWKDVQLQHMQQVKGTVL